MKHCAICGEEFDTVAETWDHGHDRHGMFHFMDPTVEGRRPASMAYPVSFDDQDRAVVDWMQGYWHASEE